MRACDHKIIQDLHINVYVPPGGTEAEREHSPRYYWAKESSEMGPTDFIPAAKAFPGWTRIWTAARGRTTGEK
jgi:hypothetical protein